MSAVIVLLYRGKGERTKCINYRGNSLSNMVRKIYAGILVERIHRVTEGLTDDEVRKHEKKNGECMWVS